MWKLCSCALSLNLTGLEPRGWRFDPQTRRQRSDRVGATYTGSPCPSAPLPPSEGGAWLGHLGQRRGKYHTGGAYKHNFKCFKIWFFTSNNDLFQATLKVADYDPVVIGTSEEMMGSRWEAHRAYVSAVGAVRLHYAASSNVVQHAGAVLLTGGEQAAAGIHCHWSNCASWVTYSVKNVMLLDAA